MLLTEEKKTEYKDKPSKLREDIKALDRKTNLTADETKLLEELKAFRVKEFQGILDAWYDYFDLAMLFD